MRAISSAVTGEGEAERRSRRRRIWEGRSFGQMNLPDLGVVADVEVGPPEEGVKAEKVGDGDTT